MLRFCLKLLVFLAFWFAAKSCANAGAGFDLLVVVVCTMLIDCAALNPRYKVRFSIDDLFEGWRRLIDAAMSV